MYTIVLPGQHNQYFDIYYFGHWHSDNVSSGIWTLDLQIVSWVIDLCVTELSRIYTLPFSKQNDGDVWYNLYCFLESTINMKYIES